ncbi:MAG: DUF1292 domain-containing protein [Lachnospiraceae bacterium]|nr:DUF1292 domain-containing protein [Lachnospiraceae bacterium]
MEEQRKDKDPEMITFETDEGPSDWYILDETRINGCNYILVADAPKGDAQCMILKDVAPEQAKESIYQEVEDDNELDIVAAMFEDLLSDTEIIG